MTLGLLLKRAIRGGELVSCNPMSVKLPVQSKVALPASSAVVLADLGALPLGFGAARGGCSLEEGAPAQPVGSWANGSPSLNSTL